MQRAVPMGQLHPCPPSVAERLTRAVTFDEVTGHGRRMSHCRSNRGTELVALLATDEHADSCGLGSAADMDFDRRGKLGTCSSSSIFGMLDGVSYLWLPW